MELNEIKYIVSNSLKSKPQRRPLQKSLCNIFMLDLKTCNTENMCSYPPSGKQSTHLLFVQSWHNNKYHELSKRSHS